MNWRGRVSALLATLTLASCASLPPPGPLAAGAESFSGRLSVRIDAGIDSPARSESAAFELQGTPRIGRMNLATPLGSVLAQARWSPDAVELVTPKGVRRFADLDSLTREVLGESVPVAALFDWLHGRPWPGAPTTLAPTPPEPGFSQLGWAVSLAQFDEGLIVARREQPPVVTVRAKLDR